MKLEFFTDARLNEMWGYIKMFLEMISPGIMISFGIFAVGLLVGIVAKSFKQASKEQDNQDYDYQEY
jgi:hypothetical protein